MKPRLIGPLLWILSIQYFAVQLIAAAAWTAHYSIRLNTISDLGNTACGSYGGRLVCSPLHGLMNVSLVVQGVTMAAGAYFLYQVFRKSLAAGIGFACFGLAGAGTILVGLFPENTVSGLHIAGATMPFLIGNIGLIVLGMVLELPIRMRVYSVLSGVVALVALGLFLSGHYLGLGTGGMERLTAYPQTVWLIVFGIGVLLGRIPTKIVR